MEIVIIGGLALVLGAASGYAIRAAQGCFCSYCDVHYEDMDWDEEE